MAIDEDFCCRRQANYLSIQDDTDEELHIEATVREHDHNYAELVFKLMGLGLLLKVHDSDYISNLWSGLFYLFIGIKIYFFVAAVVHIGTLYGISLNVLLLNLFFAGPWLLYLLLTLIVFFLFSGELHLGKKIVCDSNTAAIMVNFLLICSITFVIGLMISIYYPDTIVENDSSENDLPMIFFLTESYLYAPTFGLPTSQCWLLFFVMNTFFTGITLMSIIIDCNQIQFVYEQFTHTVSANYLTIQEYSVKRESLQSLFNKFNTIYLGIHFPSVYSLIVLSRLFLFYVFLVGIMINSDYLDVVLLLCNQCNILVVFTVIKIIQLNTVFHEFTNSLIDLSNANKGDHVYIVNYEKRYSSVICFCGFEVTWMKFLLTIGATVFALCMVDINGILEKGLF